MMVFSYIGKQTFLSLIETITLNIRTPIHFTMLVLNFKDVHYYTCLASWYMSKSDKQCLSEYLENTYSV